MEARIPPLGLSKEAPTRSVPCRSTPTWLQLQLRSHSLFIAVNNKKLPLSCDGFRPQILAWIYRHSSRIISICKHKVNLCPRTRSRARRYPLRRRRLTHTPAHHRFPILRLYWALCLRVIFPTGVAGAAGQLEMCIRDNSLQHRVLDEGGDSHCCSPASSRAHNVNDLAGHEFNRYFIRRPLCSASYGSCSLHVNPIDNSYALFLVQFCSAGLEIHLPLSSKSKD